VENHLVLNVKKTIKKRFLEIINTCV